MKYVKKHVCKNCNNKFRGKYCNECSQNINANNSSILLILKFYIKQIFDLDNKIFNTLKGLIKPGFLSNEWVYGKCIRYANPVRLFIFIFIILYLTVPHELLTKEENLFQIGKIVINNKFLFIIALPIEALLNRFFFKKYNFSYFYNIIFVLHCQTFILLIFIFNSFFLGISPFYGSQAEAEGYGYGFNGILIIELINMFYRNLAAIKFYKEKIIITIIKQISSYLCSSTLALIFSILAIRFL